MRHARARRPAYIWYWAPDSAPPGSIGLCSSALGEALCSRKAAVVAAAAASPCIVDGRQRKHACQTSSLQWWSIDMVAGGRMK